MRIRSIKPEFHLHEVLGQLPATTRLLFIGLWGLADCEGRLEDRPIRIKLQVLPYDDVDVDVALQSLADNGFIVRYEVEGVRFIAIPKFLKHQVLQGSEAKRESKIPGAPKRANQREGSTIPRNVSGMSKECIWNEDSFQGMSLESQNLLEREKERERERSSKSHCAELEPQAAPIGAKAEASQPSEPDKPPKPPPKAKVRPPKPKPERPRNALLDTIVAATGGDVANTTPSAWSAAAKALSDIKAVCPDVTPILLRQGATNYRLAHPTWPLTPPALAKNWGTLGVRSAAQVANAQPPEPDWEDTCRPPPEGWREVLCEVERVQPELVAEREWESFSPQTQLGVLREIWRRKVAAQSSEGRAAA